MRVELLRGAEADLLELYVRLEEVRSDLGERFYRLLSYARYSIGTPAKSPRDGAGLSRLLSSPRSETVWLRNLLCRWERPGDGRRHT